jgi:hypothetical protein
LGSKISIPLIELPNVSCRMKSAIIIEPQILHLILTWRVSSSGIWRRVVCWVAAQRSTWRHIPEDDTLHNHHCENLKSYIILTY